MVVCRCWAGRACIVARASSRRGEIGLTLRLYDPEVIHRRVFEWHATKSTTRERCPRRIEGVGSQLASAGDVTSSLAQAEPGLAPGSHGRTRSPA